LHEAPRPLGAGGVEATCQRSGRIGVWRFWQRSRIEVDAAAAERALAGLGGAAAKVRWAEIGGGQPAVGERLLGMFGEERPDVEVFDAVFALPSELMERASETLVPEYYRAAA
jgi:hypothetical protein